MNCGPENLTEGDLSPRLFDMSEYLGRIHISGLDTIDLLDRLSTNKMTQLVKEGDGVVTVVTTNKGRILDVVSVNKIEDGFLVVTSGEATSKICEWIDFYTFMEDVSLRNVSDKMGHVRLIGAEFLSGVIDFEYPVRTHHSSKALVLGMPCLVIRTKMDYVPCLDIISLSGSSEPLLDYLSKEYQLIDSYEFEDLRILLGLPKFGKELTESYNPLEIGLDSHISFNKGCYIGQEVVARLNTYDKVQRKLVALSWVGELPRSEITKDGKQVGVVTSRGEGIGVGLVRKTHAEIGENLLCGSVPLTIKALLSG